jgi:hypothetical protein
MDQFIIRQMPSPRPWIALDFRQLMDDGFSEEDARHAATVVTQGDDPYPRIVRVVLPAWEGFVAVDLLNDKLVLGGVIPPLPPPPEDDASTKRVATPPSPPGRKGKG